MAPSDDASDGSSLAVDHLQTSSQFGHLRLLSGRTCSVVCADRFVADHDADETLPATFWTNDRLLSRVRTIGST